LLPRAIETEPDGVRSLGPGSIADVLVAGLAIVEGTSTISLSAHSGVVRNRESRPATLKVPGPIGSRNPQHFAAYVLAQTEFLRVRVVRGVAEISVQD